MAYPQIANITTGNVASNASSSSIIAPSSTASGDLIFLIFTKDGSAAPTSLSDTDFTLLAGSADNGAASWHGIYYKKLTGALSNFTVNHASECTSWIIFRVTGGVEKESVLVNSVARGSSTTPNPGSLSLTNYMQSSSEILWISTAGWDYNRTCSAYPSNMANSRTTVYANTTQGCGTAMAATSDTNSSLDPGTYTISSTDTWNAYTIALKITTKNTKTLTSNVNISSSFTKSIKHLKSLTANISITSTIPSKNIIEAGIHIERKIGSGGTWTEIAVVPSGTSNYEDDYAFEIGTTYYYRTREYADGLWSDYSNESSVTYTATNVQYQKTLTANISLSSKLTKSVTSTWKYKKKITIDSTMVDADLTYFPLTTYLTSDNFDFLQARLDGSDIRFSSDSDGVNQLKFEKVEYKSGGVVFDGNSDYLTLADSDDWSPGSGDATWEFKLNFNDLPTTSWDRRVLFSQKTDDNNYAYMAVVYTGTELMFTLRVQSASTNICSDSFVYNFQTGVEYDLSLTKSGSYTYCHINGIYQSSGGISASYPNLTGLLYIGANVDGSQSFNGTIRGIRFTKGTARYSATNYIPLGKFENDTNTVLCMNFVEIANSTTFTDLCSKTVTTVGNCYAIGAIGIFNVLIPFISNTSDTSYYISYGNLSAFNNSTDAFRDMTGKDFTYYGTAAFKNYSNGALYDGSDDTLQLLDSDDFYFGSNDFTVECILNMLDIPAVGATYSMFSHYQDSSNYMHYFIYRDSSNIYIGHNIYIGGVNYTSGMSKVWTPSAGVDYHIAWCRSGDTMRYFVDGTQLGTDISHKYSGTRIDVPNYTGDEVYVGSRNETNNEFYGYLRGIRVFKGTAKYTSTFTSPSYFVKETNVVLCMNFQELEGATTFYDACGKTVTTLGSVIASRTGEPKKALVTDGASGNYLRLDDSDDWYIGTNDYTLEVIIYPDSLPSDGYGHTFFSQYADDNNYQRFFLYRSGSSILMFTYVKSGGTEIIGNGKIISDYTPNVPYHLAWSRSSGVLKRFCNGVQCGTDTTDTGNYPNIASYLYISTFSGSNLYDGQLRGLRFTNGIGRYTTTFTPPTSFSIDSTEVKFCSNFDSVYDKNYLMVQHLRDSLIDATGNGNTATNYGTTTSNSIYGTIRSFTSASSQYIRIPQTNLKPANQLTLLALACPASGDWSTNKSAIIGFNQSGGYGLNVHDHVASNLSFTLMQNSVYTPTTIYSYDSIADGYKVITGIADGRYRKLGIDGTTVATSDMGATYTINYPATVYDFLLGNDPGTSAPEADTYWNGFIGTVKVSNIARSEAWVEIEALALKNADGLLTFTDYTPSTITLKVNVGGVWKTSTDVKVNIGGVWKTVESIKVNIGGIWKTLTS